MGTFASRLGPPRVCRLVAAGCSALSLLLAWAAADELLQHAPGLATLESVEVLCFTLILAAGLAWFAASGKLPAFLLLAVHLRPRAGKPPEA